MFRTSITRVIRGRFRAAVLWAMVPLAGIGGPPVLGCICADGTYKTACPMLREALTQKSGAHPEVACCGQPNREQTCDCCESQTGGEASLASHQCCHPVVDAPVLPPVGDAVAVMQDQELVLAAVGIDSDGFGEQPAHVRVDDDTGLPTPDLVVTLRRLII